MLVPAALKGKHAEVMRRSRKIVGSLDMSADLELNVGELVNIGDGSDVIVLEGPNPFFATRFAYGAYGLSLALVEREVAEGRRSGIYRRLFSWSLKEPWRFVGLLGEQFSWYLAEDPSICAAYLEAVLRFWAEFEQEGPRFASLNVGEFWQVRSGIRTRGASSS